MKADWEKRGDYARLKSKIFRQGLGILALAFLIILGVYGLIWRDNGGNWVVSFMRKFLRMDEASALSLYRTLFRDNAEIIWIVSTVIIFVILFRFFINWLTRYFREVGLGIDLLLDDKGQEIVLPPEMSEIEKRLNEARQTLEKRELEARLAEQRKNDLVVYLAHDIRTPLTSVIGYLSLLDEVTDMPQEQRIKYVHITLDKANRLDKLINEFFEITRYNLQQITLEKENIDLCYMLVQLTDEFYPILNAHGNTAKLMADEKLTVYADPEKLARVFNNIFKNAIAYSYKDTVIEIWAENIENKIRIFFRNSGKTIPEKKLASIFEKFYRLDEARATNTGGAGLGLAIAKEIVTLHGGEITAVSENEVTTFCVTLPPI